MSEAPENYHLKKKKPRFVRFARWSIMRGIIEYLREDGTIQETEHRAKIGEGNERTLRGYQELERLPTDGEFREAYGKAEADKRTDHHLQKITVRGVL